MMEKKIGFIGCGNMGKAILGGLIASGQVLPGQIWVYTPSPDKVAALRDEFGINASQSAQEVAQVADIVFGAVKPGIMVKVLSEYILSLGQEAYIPNFFCKAYRPVLYIPSKEEVKELLQKMDIRTSHNSEQFRLDRECKILFLLYFCCGLRLSEGRLLKWEHIDLDKGILTVLGSKGNKDRLVYLPQDSLPVLKNYKERQEMLFPGIDWAFPGKDPHKPVSCSGVESSFNRHWAMLPVARTVDKHPTPHCLRHAFVVERFNEWMHQGIDTNTMLPYLSRYLGHKSPDETYYYYHLVEKAFDTIREKDSVSGKVIPEVIPYEE